MSPRQNVDRADDIGVVLEAAIDASELRLCRPVADAHASADWTGLARVLRRYGDEPAAAPRQFVIQLAAELEPALVEDDHVHLLVEYPPKVSISSLVNSRKGVSSRMLRKQRPDIRRRYWKGRLWSPSYFAASCGGAPISIVRQYIEQQQMPH